MTTYKLTYFNIMGLGDSVRFLLSYLGKEFEDYRIKDFGYWWSTVKPTMPFGKLPLLEIGEEKLHQTIAICRYLGKQAKLAGDNDWEELQIDMAMDSLSDFRLEVWPYFYSRDEKVKAKLKGPLMEVTAPYYLDKFDKLIEDNGGYLANGKLSWGDLYFVSILEYFSFMLKLKIIDKYPNIKKLNDKVMAIPAIKAWVEKRPKTEW